MERMSYVLSIIASSITIIVAIGGAITGIFIDEKMLSLVFVIIALFLSIVIFLLFLQRPPRKYPSKFVRWLKYKFCRKSNYMLLQREVYYEYTDRTHMNHRKEFQVRALNDNFESIPDRYIFSGSTPCKIYPLVRAHHITDEYKENGYNFYSIKVDCPQKKGSIITTGMQMDTIHDPQCEAKPFLSTGIYEQTKHLKMEVKFGSSVSPTNAKIRVFPNHIDRTPLYEKSLEFNEVKRTLSYEGEYPVYGYKYLISWEFD